MMEDEPLMMENLNEFFLELDQLKNVERKTYISSGERLENSAEHSWHLAMACWNFADYFELEVSVEKLIKLALIHDLGEIDAGDTFLYDSNRAAAHAAERQCVSRLTSLPGNAIGELNPLWEEQEAGASAEARVVKVVDRLLPFLLNIHNQGKTWKTMNIKRSQVLQAHQFIATLFPEVHRWVEAQVAKAVEQGWLMAD